MFGVGLWWGVLLFWRFVWLCEGLGVRAELAGRVGVWETTMLDDCGMKR